MKPVKKSERIRGDKPVVKPGSKAVKEKNKQLGYGGVRKHTVKKKLKMPKKRLQG